jgi:ERF superfamily
MTVMTKLDATPVVETPHAERVVVEPRTAAVSMTELLYMAVEKGTPVEALEKLVALHERMSQQQAQQDFANAMARFQAECPSIKRSSTANFATRQGGKMSYTFAELDEIAATVNPILARHGLSYTWDATVEGATLTCVCTVRHCHGHSTSSTIKLPTDSASAMSSQQKVGSAYTFARRLSLTAALGLTTTDEDLDGRDNHAERITDEQADAIDMLIDEVKADRAKFLKYCGVESVEEIPASKFAAAVAVLEKKRGAA